MTPWMAPRVSNETCSQRIPLDFVPLRVLNIISESGFILVSVDSIGIIPGRPVRPIPNRLWPSGVRPLPKEQSHAEACR
jgi:hypothetical protein